MAKEQGNNEKIICKSGRIDGIYYTLTRKAKDKMAIVYLEESPDKRYKAVVFPSLFKEISGIIDLGAYVRIKGVKDVSCRQQMVARGVVPQK